MHFSRPIVILRSACLVTSLIRSTLARTAGYLFVFKHENRPGIRRGILVPAARNLLYHEMFCFMGLATYSLLVPGLNLRNDNESKTVSNQRRLLERY